MFKHTTDKQETSFVQVVLSLFKLYERFLNFY